MPEKPEHVPPMELAECVRSEIACDLLKQAGEEIGQNLGARVLVYCNRTAVLELARLGDTTGASLEGEIRMRFRQTGVPSRFLFFIEGLFPKSSGVANFSGFSARGSAKISSDGKCSARYDTWVTKLRDDSWSLWV